MLKKLLSISFVLLLSSQISACAVAPPDGPVCTEVDISRGWCTMSISNEEFYIDDTHPWSPTGDPKDAMTWWDLRPTMVMLPYEMWVKVKVFIIDICAKTDQCTELKKSWERSVNGMDEQLDQKLP